VATGPTRLYIEPIERDQRIRQLELDIDGSDDAREGLLEVVRAVVAGRANSTDNNARSSGGFNAWDYGIRRAREVYRGHKDWDKFEENGVEGIMNRRLKLKITVVSTDSACDPINSPRNRTPKGPATEKMIDLSVQGTLFPVEEAAETIDGYQFWEICVADDGNAVTAELSRPALFESKYLIKFSERIFLVEPGEWEKIGVVLPDASGSDIEPAVRRK
jgi:hypothetical protein